jgi:hypothetical protein
MKPFEPKKLRLRDWRKPAHFKPSRYTEGPVHVCGFVYLALAVHTLKVVGRICVSRFSRVGLPYELNEDTNKREECDARVDHLQAIGCEMKGPLREVIGHKRHAKESGCRNESANRQPEVPERIVVAENRMSRRIEIWYSDNCPFFWA